MRMWKSTVVFLLAAGSLNLSAESQPVPSHGGDVAQPYNTNYTYAPPVTDDKTQKLYQYIGACLQDRPGANRSPVRPDDLNRRLSGK